MTHKIARAVLIALVGTGAYVVGWPGASQPPAPADPGVTVSRHRALLTSLQHQRTHRQWANRPGSRSSSPVHHRMNRLWVRSRLYFFPAQRLR